MTVEQASTSVLDDEAIQGLRELGPDGDESILREMIDLFLEDSPPRIAGLDDALGGGDARAVLELAHALKGSCANFGADLLHQYCLEMEIRGRENDLAGARAIFDAIQAEYARVQSALEALR